MANSPKIAEKFEELQLFIGHSPLIGHQVNFDISFLEYYLRHLHQDFDNWENNAQKFAADLVEARIRLAAFRAPPMPVRE